MSAYIIHRFLQGVIVIILVTILIFLLMRFLPGDPLLLYVAQADIETITEEQMAELRHQYGLDKSLPEQYIAWIGGSLRGDLGISIFLNADVSTLVAERLPVTAHLGIISLILSAILGTTFGVICGLRRGKWNDNLFTLLANLGITAPSFWVGILMIYYMALKLHWLPIYGYTSPFEDFTLSVRQSIMPILCLSLFPLAALCRQSRSTTLEVVRQDYIRTAWSKGLRERTIAIRHILKNALIPIVTILGMQVGYIFGGSVVIETVFNIPGMGRLMADAVFRQDYQIVQSGVLIIATVTVASNLAVDICYGWLDPRIRYN